MVKKTMCSNGDGAILVRPRRRLMTPAELWWRVTGWLSAAWRYYDAAEPDVLSDRLMDALRHDDLTQDERLAVALCLDQAAHNLTLAQMVLDQARLRRWERRRCVS